MTTTKELYALFTHADAKLDQFLSQVTNKLGGKKFTSGKEVICIFTKPHRACHGALYFLKKCADSQLTSISVVVLKGLQANLIKDAQYLFKSALPGQCLITDEVLKELNDVETSTEMSGDITLPASQTSTHVYKLSKYNDIVIESSDAEEELFDYSNVIETAAPPAPTLREEVKPQESMLESPLEISETNMIYDYQREQQLREELKQKKEMQPEGSKDAIPAYAAQQIEDAQNTIQEGPQDLEAEQYSKAEVDITSMEFEQPPPGLQGLMQDKRLVVTFVLGGISLFLIGFYALNGRLPFTGQEEITMESDYLEEELQGANTNPAMDQPKEETQEETAPKKRVFTPILTEDEAKGGPNRPSQTMFPQVAGEDTAYLEIKSNPPGATVSINGAILKGLTPMKTFLVYANKKLVIKISKTGYDTIEKIETIPPGQRRGFMFEMIENE
ncbi:MAG: PEGA domain-containing protein [Bdellovibrionales bacterium]|nr:PEGA domain-containing protein [Bdellovibrionales bacterium]